MNIRKSRRRFGSTATVALTALLVLASPMTALAGGGWTDGGPGSSDDSNGSHVTKDIHGTYACGQNIGLIKNALYNSASGHWVMDRDAPWPNCKGSGYSATGVVKLCPVGFEVYRFYGQPGKAPAAVTRSRLNLQSWCQVENPPQGLGYFFPGQTTWDATPNLAPGAPDFIKGTDSQSQSQNDDVPATVGRRDTGELTPSAPTKVLGTCKNVSASNPLEEYLKTASAEEQVSYYTALGDAFWNLSHTSRGYFPDSIANEFGISQMGVYPYKTPNPDPAKAPRRDSAGTHHYPTNIQWETRACASPFNFAEVDNPLDHTVTQPGALTGTCYIPLMHEAIQMVGPGGAKVLAYQALGRGYGERYSDYFARARDWGDGGNPSDRKNVSVDAKTTRAWRAAMKKDFLNRVNQLGWTGTGKQQILPAQHYPGEDDSKLIAVAVNSANAAQAAQELYSNAKCHFASKVTLNLAGHVVKDPLTAGLRLKVSDPTVLQAGGSPYRATFRVTGGQSQLICSDNQPCGSRATLTELSYTLALTGTGYKVCTAPHQASGCDYRVVSYTPGSAGRDGVLVAEFYTATPPTGKVQLVLSNLKAKYAYTEKYTGFTIDGYNPITGNAYTVNSADMEHTVEKSLTPTVTASPSAMVKSGGSYVATYPVMSAVNVPIG